MKPMTASRSGIVPDARISAMIAAMRRSDCDRKGSFAAVGAMKLCGYHV